MPICKNYPSKSFKGNEQSPLGTGYSALGENVSSIRKGLDNNLYIVKQTKSGKKWYKYDLEINFDILPTDCYVNAWIPKCIKINDTQTSARKEKFGGKYPFFIKGEKWPIDKDGIPLVFFCQFIDPRKNKNIMYRVFLPIDNENDCDIGGYHINKIELNEENLVNQIFIQKPNNMNEEIENTIYDCYHINEWNKIKELKSFDFISKKFNFPKYVYNQNNDLYNEYYNKFNDSKYYPSCGVKVGGTPQSTQGKLYSSYDLLQMSDTNYLPYGWGDCGIGHISEDCKLEWDCC
jgi:uncharacterized protein YwqG